MNTDFTARYDDQAYQRDRCQGDHDCPCPFCNRTGSTTLITEHFFEAHPVYEQKHALLYAIESGTVYQTTATAPIRISVEPYRVGIQEHRPLHAFEIRAKNQIMLQASLNKVG